MQIDLTFEQRVWIEVGLELLIQHAADPNESWRYTRFNDQRPAIESLAYRINEGE